MVGHLSLLINNNYENLLKKQELLQKKIDKAYFIKYTTIGVLTKREHKDWVFCYFAEPKKRESINNGKWVRVRFVEVD